MFFWILIKLNLIPILICWKKILYLENFSTQNQQLTFSMSPFTTNICYFFQWQFPLRQSLKPQNIAPITSSIIHMTYQLTKYLIISTEKCKIILLIILVVLIITCLLPKYRNLLPLSQTFIDHAVKHKKTIKN